MKSKNVTRLGLFLALLAMSVAATQATAEIAVKQGQKVAFLGDSITAGGWDSPSGYVRLVVSGLNANGLNVTPAPAGIGGHKSNNMLERLNRDVLSKKPDWMTLSCGVNDVWHGANGVPLDQYKTNIATIVEQCQAAGIKVMLLTATVIGEELDNDNNKKLIPYNDYLRELAKEKKCLLADLNAEFQTIIKASAKPGRVLTADGVHMNPEGDQVMARCILKSFGLDADQSKKAQEAWKDIPNGATVRASYDAGNQKTLKASCKFTLRQFEQLKAAAAKENKSLDALANAWFAEDVKAMLKPAGEYESVEAIFEAKKDKDVQAALKDKLAKRLEALLH